MQISQIRPTSQSVPIERAVRQAGSWFSWSSQPTSRRIILFLSVVVESALHCIIQLISHCPIQCYYSAQVTRYRESIEWVPSVEIRDGWLDGGRGTVEAEENKLELVCYHCQLNLTTTPLYSSLPSTAPTSTHHSFIMLLFMMCV